MKKTLRKGLALLLTIAMCISAMPLTVLADTTLPDPVAWYKFNETSGNTVADAMGGPSATIKGTSYAWEGGGLNLKNGTTIDHGGSSAYVELPLEPFLKSGSPDKYTSANNLTDYTFSMWLDVTANNQFQRYLQMGTNLFWLANLGGDQFIYKVDSTKTANITYDASTLSKGTMPGSGWRHIALTLSDNGDGSTATASMYIDGINCGTINNMPAFTTIDIGYYAGVTSCWLGRSAASGDYYYDGKYSDFRIYDQALTATQVATLAATAPEAPGESNPTPDNVNLSVAGAFGNDMVLQRGTDVAVWGEGTQGDTITVSFAGQTKTGVVGDDNKWEVVLDPMTASKESRTMTVTDGHDGSVSFTNVLVGEVWNAAGQSNMEFNLGYMDPDLVANAATQGNPYIRVFKENTPSTGWAEPQENPLNPVWYTCDNSTGLSGCTAIGYYFARTLYEELDVPVGIMQTAVGGTNADTWVSMETLQSNPLFEKYIEKLENMSAADGSYFKRPTSLYNGRLAPIAKYATKGVIWYQGEDNYNDPTYKQLFPALIQNWRDTYNNPDMPFYFVQLASFGVDYSNVREIQHYTNKFVDNTAVISIGDLGDPNDIHPLRKEPVGQRLGRAALTETYGLESIADYTGPLFESMEIRDGAAYITFSHADGLHTREVIYTREDITASNGKPNDFGTEEIINDGPVKGFQICGVDGLYHDATAEIQADGTVKVYSANVEEPVAVRHAWGATPEVNLCNSADIPAVPFRATSPKAIVVSTDFTTIDGEPITTVPEDGKVRLLMKVYGQTTYGTGLAKVTVNGVEQTTYLTGGLASETLVLDYDLGTELAGQELVAVLDCAVEDTSTGGATEAAVFNFAKNENGTAQNGDLAKSGAIADDTGKNTSNTLVDGELKYVTDPDAEDGHAIYMKNGWFQINNTQLAQTGDFSVAMRFKMSPNHEGLWHMLATIYGQTSRMRFMISNNNYLTNNITTTTGNYEEATPGLLQEDRYYNVLYVFRGAFGDEESDKLEVYVDGEKIYEKTDLVVGAELNSNWIIGTTGEFFDGYFDYVRFYEGAFSLTDALAMTQPHTALAAPSGAAWDSTTASKATWQKVEGATKYYVQLYDNSGNKLGSPAVVTGEDTTEYDFISTFTQNVEGTYTFSVAAVGDGKTTYSSGMSAKSDSRYYKVEGSLSEPTNVGWNGTTATWNAVSGAESYSLKLYKKGQVIAEKTATSNSINFADDIAGYGSGVYSYSIIAVDSTGTNKSKSIDSTSYSHVAQDPDLVLNFAKEQGAAVQDNASVTSNVLVEGNAAEHAVVQIPVGSNIYKAMTDADDGFTYRPTNSNGINITGVLPENNFSFVTRVYYNNTEVGWGNVASFSHDRSLRFLHDNSGAIRVPPEDKTGATLTNGQWYTLGYVYNVDDKQVKTYVDGVCVNTKSYSSAMTVPSIISIAGNGGSQESFRGYVDYFKFYNRVVSDADMINLTKAVEDTSPKYQLTVVADSSAHGTVTGSGEYKEGAVVPVTATRKAGYTFKNWTVSGPGTITNATSASTTFTMGGAAATLTAVFEEAQTSQVQPVAWYKFNEASGTEVHDAMGGPSAQVKGTRFEWDGSGLNLTNGTERDENSAYVELPLDPFLKSGTANGYTSSQNLTDFTFSMWMDITANNLYQRYIELADDNFWLANIGNDAISWKIGGTRIDYDIGETEKGGMVGSGWRHIALTLSDNGNGTGKAVIYIDGVARGTLDNMALLTSLDLSQMRWLGKSMFPDYYYDGKYSDLRIYDVALDSTEIARLSQETPISNTPYSYTLTGSGKYIIGGQNYTVSVDLTNATGSYESLTKATLVTALYDSDGNMIAMNNKGLTVTDEGAKDSLALAIPQGVDHTYTLKAFLVSDMDTIIPLGDTITVKGINPNGDITSDLAENWPGTLVFDGNTNYLTENKIGEDFSIAFWMNSDADTTTASNFYSGTGLINAEVGGVVNDFGIVMGGNTGSATQANILFGIGVAGTSDYAVRGTTVVNDGQWHHVVCTREMATNTLQIYVDGELEAEQAVGTTSGVALTSPQKITIGSISNGSGKLVGGLADIRFYTRVLGQQDITLLQSTAPSGPVPEMPEKTDNLRILTMGDSITYGTSATVEEEQRSGYRRKLWQDITNAGYGVEFVGRQTNGPENMGSYNNEGWPGCLVQAHIDNLPYEMAFKPDIVLLMIGTNDINVYWPGSTSANPEMLEATADRLTTLLDGIFAGFESNGTTNGKVYLAKITKRYPWASGNVTILDCVDHYNEQIEEVYNAQKALGRNIELVDMYTPLDYATDMYDGLHPTAAGYDKMGDVWFEAIKGDFGITGNEVNLAKVADVEASSEATGFEAANAVDGNIFTGWRAADDSYPQSLEIDLGAVKAIDRVVTQFGAPKAGYYYKIEYSVDGEDWEVLADKFESTCAEPVYIDHAPDNTTARYVKLTVVNSVTTPNTFTLWDIGIF